MHRSKTTSTLELPKYRLEKNKFYKITALIIGSKLVHISGFRNDYVEYYLKIKTNYGHWKLKKRYDDFYKLNDKIVNIIPEVKVLFPPKKFFKNSDGTIRERIKLFNKYLKFLFSKINIFLFDDILDFILLDKEIVSLFITKYSMLKIDEENYVYMSLKNAFNRLNNISPSNYYINNHKFFKNIKENKNINVINENNDKSINNKINYYEAILQYEKKKQASFDWDENDTSTPNLIVIREFLHNLSEKLENKMEILQTFESFMKKGTKWIKFNPKEIEELLVGNDKPNDDEKSVESYMNRTRTISNHTKISCDYNFHSTLEFLDPLGKQNDNFSEEDEQEEDKIKGLFHQIGNYENNIILSVGSLEFLSKLLNTEYNPDAETYINIFKTRKINEYQFMNLNKVIKSNIGGNKTNFQAMKLLQLIFQDKNKEENMRDIMIDDIVFKQYTNYINKFLE